MAIIHATIESALASAQDARIISVCSELPPKLPLLLRDLTAFDNLLLGDVPDAVAASLAVHADELIAASQARDPAAASRALRATRETCRECHHKYR